MPTTTPNANDGASGGTAMEVQPKVEVQKEPVSFFNREPVVIMAAVRAVIYLAVSYGFDMSPEQMTAIIVTIESVLALFTRNAVTPFVPAGTTPNVRNEANTPMLK